MSVTKKAMGIDIGGTKIAVAAVEQFGKIAHREVIPTLAEQGFEKTVGRINLTIESVIKQASWQMSDVSGIGIGCAGPVDHKTGIVSNAYTLFGWESYNIIEPFKEQFGVPVILENDADAAVLGESYAGAGRGIPNVVVFTIGTGVGGGAIVDGNLYRGPGGWHPEYGHISIMADGPQCYCGKKGCLESLASGSALTAMAQEAGFMNSREVFKQAAEGEEKCKKIVDQTISVICMAVWTLMHTLVPERIVLGGGVMEEHYDLFEPPLKEMISKGTMIPRDTIQVVRAELGNNAGVVGAASMFLRD